MIRGQIRPGLAPEDGLRGHLHGKMPPMPTQHCVRLPMDQQFQLGKGKPGPNPLDQAFGRHLRHAEVVGERVDSAGGFFAQRGLRTATLLGMIDRVGAAGRPDHPWGRHTGPEPVP